MSEPIPFMKPDRRRYPRVAVARRCKLRADGSTRFFPAETADVSTGGALVRVPAEHAVKLGQQVEVGVAWQGEAVLSDEILRPAVVRRVHEVGEDQLAVGLEFADECRLPDVVVRPVAA